MEEEQKDPGKLELIALKNLNANDELVLEEEQRDPGKLELIALKSFNANDELVYVVDFLNKSLKDRKIMFGLTKDKETGQMKIHIYGI